MNVSPSSLPWPPEDLPAEVAREAAALLVTHTVPGRAGETDDPAVVAAVVGAEQAAVLIGDRQALGEQVDTLLAALADPGERHHRDGDVPPPAPDDVEVARCLVQALERIAVRIQGRDERRPPEADAINVEAGQHVVASEESLLRAAVRAGHRSFVSMPYYGLRYGERGWRFTSSDSAWLGALVDHRAQTAIDQVRWLARVLAVRGMPSWLLEMHLDVLANEISAVTSHARAESLRAAGEDLRGRRRQVVDDHALDDADHRLTAAVTAEGGQIHVPRAGALVAAAAADVRLGLTDDDQPCVGWLADPDHFDAVWGRAIDEIRGSFHHDP